MKKGIAKILLVTISVLVSIAVLELLSGYLFENLPNRFSNGKRLVEIYVKKPTSIPSSIEPHPYLLYQNTPNFRADGYLQHNSLGYRNKEFVPETFKSSVRILAVGGSTTHMYPYVKNPDDTWVSQLEVMLKEKINPKTVTINAGLPYATTAELLSSYVFRHKYLKPDILIIHTGGNDIAPLLFDNYNPEYTHFRAQGSGRNPRRFEPTLLSVSNFFKVIYAIWLTTNESVYQSQPFSFSLVDRHRALDMVTKNDSEGFRRNLDTLIKVAQDDGVKVVLFGFLQAREEFLSRNREDLKGIEKAFVVALEKHYNIMRDLSNKYNIPFITPDQSLFEDSWFLDNCHLNEQGEKTKAKILFDYFSREKEGYFKEIRR